MSSQSVPIHRTNATSSKKDDTWFNPFDFSAGQDANIRWLSRPSQQSTQGKYSKDTEKFRITFDAENFKPEQIKVSFFPFSLIRDILVFFLALHSKSSIDHFGCV